MTALVTGGGTGIGRACGLALHNRETSHEDVASAVLGSSRAGPSPV